MTPNELDSLAKDLEVLRKAVRRNSPFLRELSSSPFFGLLSLPLGILLTGFSLATHFLVAKSGSFEALPGAWKLALGLFTFLFCVVAGVAKFFFIDRKAKSLDKGASFATVFKLFYGSVWGRINLPTSLAFLAIAVFILLAGRPWYLVPASALFMTVAAGAVGLIVQRPEYDAMGWYALVSGVASLFFVERAPWLWLAVVYGGVFIVFGLVDLLSRRGRGDEGGNGSPR